MALDTFGEWFNMPDHTSGDETGRMGIINGSFKGQPFFTETINVKSSTPYVFSAWICNINKTQGTNLH